MIINDQSSAGTERNVWYCVEENHKTDEMHSYTGIIIMPKAYVWVSVVKLKILLVLLHNFVPLVTVTLRKNVIFLVNIFL